MTYTPPPRPVPRFPPARGSLAEAAARTIPEHVEKLLEFRINDTTPFGMTVNSGAQDLLDQAHAMLIIMSLAIDEVADRNGDSPMRPAHVASVLTGISSLIALSAYVSREGAARC